MHAEHVSASYKHGIRIPYTRRNEAHKMHTNTRIMHTYTRGTYAAFGLLFGAFLAASVEHGGLLLGNQRLAKLNWAGE